MKPRKEDPCMPVAKSPELAREVVLATPSSHEVMKIVLSSTLAIIVTGAGSWMVFGHEKVTRPEMETYVEKYLSQNSPWKNERGEITSAQKRNTENIAALSSSVSALVKAQTDTTVELRVLVERVEMLLRGKEIDVSRK
jgi:hypothetical protein